LAVLLYIEGNSDIDSLESFHIYVNSILVIDAEESFIFIIKSEVCSLKILITTLYNPVFESNVEVTVVLVVSALVGSEKSTLDLKVYYKLYSGLSVLI
jgi:hypothetical protein